MKKVILALLMIGASALAAKASADDCASVLNSMASMTYSYTSLVYTCRAAAGTPNYPSAQQSARQVESAYQTVLESCRLLCANDPSSLRFCYGALTGACQ